jgi:hypothetical protein
VSSPPDENGELLAWRAWMLRPVPGLGGRSNVVPTTYVVGYYLSPFGLGKPSICGYFQKNSPHNGANCFAFYSLLLAGRLRRIVSDAARLADLSFSEFFRDDGRPLGFTKRTVDRKLTSLKGEERASFAKRIPRRKRKRPNYGTNSPPSVFPLFVNRPFVIAA